jgi:SAM-dependent methyltransferase
MRRWDLSDAERERVLAAWERPLGGRQAVLALLREPGVVLGALRRAMRKGARSFRDDSDAYWTVEVARLRAVVPDAALGVHWLGTDVFLRALLPRLDSTTRALELGCGGGRISRHAAPVVRELVCTDISDVLLGEARKALAGFDNVTLQRTNGYTLSQFPDDSFDVVYAHDVLEYVDPRQALGLLDEVRRVLRPGGRCVVSLRLTLDRPGWARRQLELARAGARAGRFGEWYPRPYTADQVQALFRVAGFEHVEGSFDESDDPDEGVHYIVVAQ